MTCLSFSHCACLICASASFQNPHLTSDLKSSYEGYCCSLSLFLPSILDANSHHFCVSPPNQETQKMTLCRWWQKRQLNRLKCISHFRKNWEISLESPVKLSTSFKIFGLKLSYRETSPLVSIQGAGRSGGAGWCRVSWEHPLLGYNRQWRQLSQLSASAS